MIRPIRTEADYRGALRRIEELMCAEPDTEEFDTLEVLSTLVEKYEEEHFPMDLPSPAEAIRFRMEQEALSARDLVPYIGSRAKVSEILSGKRPLTLQMIRALHEHLGVPAEVLLGQAGSELPDDGPGLDWGRFPLKAMAKYGWIVASVGDALDRAEEIMRAKIQEAGDGLWGSPAALYRKNEHSYRNTKSDPYALHAWCLEVLGRARKRPLAAPYKAGAVTPDFVREVVRLSWSKEGPRLAQEYLAGNGIHLIVLAHLPKTYLDGAAMLLDDGTPVVGLTLRYDRIDAFWFNLAHELAHVALHLSPDTSRAFLDDFDLKDGEGVEREADDMAEEALVPGNVWQNDPIRHRATPMAVLELAHRLRVHPAIIAGRVRHETRNYRLLSQFVGSGEVRPLFQADNPSAWKQ